VCFPTCTEPCGCQRDANKALLDQSWELPEDPENLDDAWEELAPAPGEFRRTVMKGAIVLVLIGPTILTLISLIIRSLGS